MARRRCCQVTAAAKYRRFGGVKVALRSGERRWTAKRGGMSYSSNSMQWNGPVPGRMIDLQWIVRVSASRDQLAGVRWIRLPGTNGKTRQSQSHAGGRW